MCTNRRKEGEGEGGEDDDGGVDAGETGDEGLALGFALAGMLHEGDDLRDSALAKSLRGTDTEDTREVHTTRDDLITDIHVARQRLSRQGDGVQGRCTLDDHTVQRNLLTRLDYDDRTYGNILWTEILYFNHRLHGFHGF